MLVKTKKLGTTKVLTKEQEKSRRLKYVLISKQMLVLLLRQGEGGCFYSIKGMPEDAEVVDFSMHYAFAKDLIAVKVCSDEFPIVPEACTAPQFELECSVYQEAGPMHDLVDLVRQTET